MSRRKPPTALLRLSMLFMTLNSAILIIIPWVTAEKIETGHSNLLVIMCAAFWFTTICAYTLLVFVNYVRRKLLGTQAKTGYKHWGLLRIFTNFPALVVDEILLVALTGFLILAVIAPKKTITFVFFAILIFSLQMHGVLNGQNYRWCSKRGKYQRKEGKTKQNSNYVEGTSNEEKNGQ